MLFAAALLSLGSGAAALMYEVVWLQLLQLAIGGSAVSIGLLLGSFMGGMCLGSLLLPRAVSSDRHPLFVYAAFEFAIGLSGLLLLWGMPRIGGIYERFGHGDIGARMVVASICLIPPAALIGAALPILARWTQSLPSAVAGLGWLYASNLAGAVGGTLLAGFYLLRLFDINVATYVAAGINAAVGMSALCLGRWSPAIAAEISSRPPDVPAAEGRLVHLVASLSGLAALSCQVVWTRLLALTFGATVYSFSLILAAFLVGLGAGSGVAAVLLRRTTVRPRVALGWCQFLASGAIALAAWLLTDVMPYWSASEAASPWHTLGLDVLRAFLVVMPAAAAWGASFPFALASLAGTQPDHGRLVSGLYAANTAGAIVGALVTSLLLVATLGSQHTQQVMVGIMAVSALLAFMSVDATRPVSTRLCVALGIELVLLIPAIAPVPGILVAYGRRSAEWAAGARVVDTGHIVYSGEGVADFVAVSQGADGARYYHAAGKVQASTLPEDMRLQLLLAHTSHLLSRHPGNVLVIGCGAGITAGALATSPAVDHLTIADIEPLVPRVADTFFRDYNHGIVRDPRVTLRIDDGRHFLATTRETFDVITTDLIDPWVKGVAALFTREFFESARRHLRPGGVVTQFVQLYQSNPETVRSEIATFVEAFPNAVLWGNPREGQGYDLVLLGQVEPVGIDVDAMQRRLDSPAYRAVTDSLRSIGIGSAIDLLSTYAGSGSDLRGWLSDAPINLDRNLRLQYLAGLGLNADDGGPIYRDILERAVFPAAAFTGSPSSLAALRTAIASRRAD